MNEDKDDLGQLLRTAGRRPEPSPEAVARIRSHVHGQWQAGLRARRRRRNLAVAASLLLVFGGSLFLWSSRQHPPTAIVARIAHGGENLQIDRHGLSFLTEADPDLLAAGDRVSTGAGAGALLAQLPSGTTTLRLDRSTTLEWLAPDRLRLISGRLYVDTGHDPQRGDAALPPSEPLVIEAGKARVQHVGTQFTASVDADKVSVGVRDGVVLVAVDGNSESFSRGELATVSNSGRDMGVNPIRRGRLTPSGETWRWADELAPRLPIEGRNLVAILNALAYQAGLTLSFANEGVEADALATTLHGPVLDMTPEAALQAILATTSFRSVAPADGSADHIVIDIR